MECYQKQKTRTRLNGLEQPMNGMCAQDDQYKLAMADDKCSRAFVVQNSA